ncbi:hypothetical protein J6J34_11955 [Pseudidiomarina sp. 1ASP75-14]|uniref:hypothetical protein n=1 Tax=Pseudidiomarina terrestris TaxID=2820060 RepID=UPI0026520AF9|nr:hypothetical protein [Pseudidiomarina sp. 1ASP75-14]MDN7138923.1 hypothetical protein [Pseudidiomarina sp. 1ASP75-14]
MPWSKLWLTIVLLLAGCQSTPKAAQQFDSNLEQQRQVAMQAYRQGDYHLAQGLLQKLAAHPVADPQAACFLGAIYFRQHEYHAALNSFESCREQQPEQLEIWFNSAAIHLRLASELLLTGKSYARLDASAKPVGLERNYNELLQALLRLQRIATAEASVL